jgi:hypothetical protein
MCYHELSRLFKTQVAIGTIFRITENIFEFNLNLINKPNFIKRFAQTFPSRTTLNEAGPLIIFCKLFHLVLIIKIVMRFVK